MSLVPSPPPDASTTTRGLVSTGAQEFAGAKTLTGTLLNGVTSIAEAVTALVRAVGAALVMRSSLGASSSDVAVKVGTSESDAGTNASAKLLSVRTGLGGTEVESLAIRKGGVLEGAGGSLTISTALGSRLVWGSNQLVLLGGSGELATVGPTAVRSTGTATDQTRMYSAASASGNRAVVLGSSSTDGTINAECLLTGFATGIGISPVAKAAVTAMGRFDQSGSDSSGSPGAATINKPTGKSAVASGASSVTITNSVVAAASRVMVTFHADPGARYWVVPAAGSFTVHLSSAAGADLPFSWEVANLI